MTRMLILLVCCCLFGCESVQPWERGTLAREEMQWDTDVMETSLQKQIQFAKEASSGGNGAAGGGCGCN